MGGHRWPSYYYLMLRFLFLLKRDCMPILTVCPNYVNFFFNLCLFFACFRSLWLLRCGCLEVCQPVCVNKVGTYFASAVASTSYLAPCSCVPVRVSEQQVVGNSNVAAMTSDVLTKAERADMIKLAKSVAIKSAAIIVQSRDGKTVLTKCNPNPTDHTLVSADLLSAFVWKIFVLDRLHWNH